MQEIISIAAIERLAEVRRKGVLTDASGTAAILVWMATDDLVETLTIGRRDVLHIGDILQSALYLERSGTGLDQFLQMVALVHILQGEQVTVALHFPTLGIDQRELHPAELRTLATVGAASETMLGGVTDAGITDAQGPVDEDLQLDIRHLTMNLCNLVDG